MLFCPVLLNSRLSIMWCNVLEFWSRWRGAANSLNSHNESLDSIKTGSWRLLTYFM